MTSFENAVVNLVAENILEHLASTYQTRGWLLSLPLSKPLVVYIKAASTYVKEFFELLVIH